MINPRRTLIVDGVTQSGKSTLVGELRKIIPGITYIKFSDYYHKQLQRGLSHDVVQEYNLKRFENTVSMMQDAPVDDFVIERLHPTDYVYCEVVLSAKPAWNYDTLEEKLNELQAILVLLTLPDRELEIRMQMTLENRVRKSGASTKVPGHILDYESNRWKRDLYSQFYEKSKMKRKFLFDTSMQSPQEIVRAILM